MLDDDVSIYHALSLHGMKYKMLPGGGMTLDDIGLRANSPASGYAKAATGYQTGAVDDSEHENRTAAMRSEFRRSLSTSCSELGESLMSLGGLLLYGPHVAAREAARYSRIVCNNR